MRKFLFIGLGGSGGKTLRYLRSDLERWLAQIGWTGGFPSGWQLLQIDTPSEQDGKEITEVDMLPTDSYVGLVGNGISFENVSTQLTAGAKGSEGWQDLASWRVNPTFLKVPITMGAGQYRAVGRSIGLAYADQILQAIRRAEKRLMQADASAELDAVAELAGVSRSVNPIPVAVVVSSLAGGSGAGLLMDTCDLLRQVGGEWGDHSFGILYTADVFSQISSGGGGVQPNTLAALSEVLNGHWLSPTAEQPTGRINPLLSAAGAAIPVSRSGPAYPFLVGASNTKGVSFGDQQSVYRMMGRALRSWTIDQTVQDSLIAYTITNWNNEAKSNVVQADVLLQHHEPVFEAYGFSEVNLGTELFEQYASERLARLAAQWLHDAHNLRARKIDPNEARQPDEIIEEFADQLLPGFLDAAGLNEKGPDRNQVIDAIRPSDFDAKYLTTCDQLFDQVVAGVPQKGMNRDEWLMQIQGFLDQFADAFIREVENDIRSEAGRWAEEQPDRTIAALTGLIADAGLTVAGKVLEKAIKESNETVSELVSEAADDFERHAGGAAAAGQIAAKLNISGRVPPSNLAIREAVEAGFAAAGFYIVEARRRRQGADLLREFTKNFLQPLRRSVHAAAVDLKIKGYDGEGLAPAVVLQWADEAVPNRLEPPKNERLVMPTASFRTQFETLIQMGLDDAGLDEALARAREEIINGFFLEDLSATKRDERRAVRKNQRWVIDPNLINGGTGTPTAASFTLAYAPSDLLERSLAWLRRPGTAFQRLLDSDLRSYLTDDGTVDPVALNERRTSFRNALTAALDSAEPLVEIDQALKSLLHPQSDAKPNARPGGIPLKDHPLEADVREILAGALGGGEVDGILTTETRVTSIPISSTLGAAHDPLIFESISSPIISSWASVAGTPAAMNFWLNRRARPVSEFIPASQQLIRSMVRGWFTGVMLGRIDRQELRIAKADGEVVSFPSTLLTQVDRQGRDLLPSVLESLGLAYIQVAQLHSTSPLDAYSELRDLGSEASGGKNFREYDGYEVLNESLREWVRTGSFGVTTLVKPVLDRDGLGPSSSPDDRATVASKFLDSILDQYRKEYESYAASIRKNANNLGPDHALWTGMFGHIERALVQLRDAFDGTKSISAGEM